MPSGIMVYQRTNKGEFFLMLVAVKTETLINTPWDATLVPRSVLRDLNRVQRLSDSQKKTCFNSSKGGRIPVTTPKAQDTHNLFLSVQGKVFSLATFRKNAFFSPKGIPIPPLAEARGILEILG